VLWQYSLSSESDLPDMATTYVWVLSDEKKSVLCIVWQWRDFSWGKYCNCVQKRSFVRCPLLEL